MNFIYGGFFYPDGGDYAEGLSVVFRKLININIKKESLGKIREEFSKLIKSTEYKPEEEAEYHIMDVIWQKPRELFRGERTGTFDRYKKDAKFDIIAGIVSTAGEISKRVGLAFLRLLIAGEVERIDKQQMWDCRKTMVELWKDMTKDKEIEKHLENVLMFERVVEEWTTKDAITNIAIKPANVEGDRFKLPDNEQFYHSALQVFSTEGPGWERDEVYSEKRSLFLLALLALSNYESESFITPYAKLGLWQRKKNIYLKLRRDNREYTMGLSGVLYELLYLASRIPGHYKQFEDQE
ncbi:MAG: hypothetical protein D6674_04615 [Acidobacteria bacterium]|nr:MAG: hypothetical protein D6674_04615 [Acidobacteriota bacterium]